MKQLKNTILKQAFKAHRYFAWLGGLALLIFGISGMMHPLMAWTGPKAAAFFPPQVTFQPEFAAAIPEILKENAIEQAIMVKLVPSEVGAVLQVTERVDEPRRYFDLNNGEELIGFDQQQAVWLAKYYSGIDNPLVKDIQFQTEFDAAYPWVNRLLPVYRISFDTHDEKTLFVYTELGALAHITNQWKTAVQALFRILHRWEWLSDVEHARVWLMMLLLLSLLGMAVTGISMVLVIKNRRMQLNRKIHRLMGYIIWLPLLMFCVSGIYHLLQYAYGDNHRGLMLGKPMLVTHDRFGKDVKWLSDYRHIKLNGISLVEGPSGDLLYRLSLPQGRPGQSVKRAKRFDGVPIEKASIYFNATKGSEENLSDQAMSIFYAKQRLGLDESLIKHTELVTKFGPHYDFRNKRLPVWRIDYDSEQDDKVFIDPATGMLVDRLVKLERYEGYSFSFLHKWNFLRPVLPREMRDLIMVLILLTSVFSTLVGYSMLLKIKVKTRRSVLATKSS